MKRTLKNAGKVFEKILEKWKMGKILEKPRRSQGNLSVRKSGNHETVSASQEAFFVNKRHLKLDI